MTAEDAAVPLLAPDYPIETERLLLRPIDPVGDVDAIHAYLSREDVCAYIPFSPMTREQVVERYRDPKRFRSVLTEGGQALGLAVVLKETGELIGDVLLMWNEPEHRGAEIGYVFNPAHHGHGYATEAARVLLGLGFDGLGLHRIHARIEDLNPASGAVLSKIGMRQEAVLVENEWFKERWSTEVDFAILDREWRALQRP
ncbi:GNAT family N-acetyltransferase [uncultured Amnibacterium sp.]|uniref:GNAT family N-acetyltransferase n=1 Tax=uncultured Amnibacterium sp. TaxID=1631851 RepID=UPI0035CB1FFF